MTDTIFDSWPTAKTLDAGRSYPKETASPAFGDGGRICVIFLFPPSSPSMVLDRVIEWPRSDAARPKKYRLVYLSNTRRPTVRGWQWLQQQLIKFSLGSAKA